MMKKKRLKASELIAILQKNIAEHGDLEITVDTQEGSSYNLYSEDCVHKVEWTRKDGSKIYTLEIG